VCSRRNSVRAEGTLPSIEEILRRDAIGRLQCKRDAASTDSTPIGRGWEAGCRSDLALHLGEVLYSNVGAVDRLEVTVIGPAVNEVARVEKLCEPLRRRGRGSSRSARTSCAEYGSRKRGPESRLEARTTRASQSRRARYGRRAYCAGSIPTYPLMSAYQILPPGSVARL
jgi:hypothetical protein